MKYKKDLCNMLQHEIREIEKLEKSFNKDFEETIDVILHARGKVIFSGVGKSAHVARKMASTFSSVGIPSFFINSNESLHGDLGVIEKDDIVIMVSNSGNTRELCIMLDALENIGCTMIAITGNTNSYLAKMANYKVIIEGVMELNSEIPAPTCSTTSFMIAGDIIAMKVAKLKKFTAKDFYSTHPGGILGENSKRLLEIG